MCKRGLVDEVGLDNNGSEIDVTESTGLDGMQTCGKSSLMPSTSPEGAKLRRTTCSSTHVATDMSLKNNDGSLPLASQRKLLPRSHPSANSARTLFQLASVSSSALFKRR